MPKTIFMLATGILAISAMNRTAPADSITIDFNGLSGSNGSAFTNYTESGFTVSSVSGSWLVGQNYGDPPPFLYAEGTSTATIAVRDGGNGFSFSSIDLYSSITTIPYTFTGFGNNNMLFTVSGTVPNTFGNFALVTNPDSTVTIDTLDVTLTNPLALVNPVGLDNIAMVTASSSAPEPTSLALLLASLASLNLLRQWA